MIAENEAVPIGSIDVDYAKRLVDELKKTIEGAHELDDMAKRAREGAQRAITEYALSVKMSKVNPDYLDAFFKQPFPALRPVKGHPDVWELALPRFMDVQVGYLVRQDPAWNYFQVSRLADWLGEVPESLRKQLGWQTPPDLVIEGETLKGPPKALAYAREKYADMVSPDKEEGVLRINPRRSFDLLVSLLDDGIRPFSRKPADPKDFVERPLDFELRPYQKAGWAQFLEYSNGTFLWPPSVGKTFIVLYAMTHLRGPHLVAVRQRVLLEQWVDRVQAHTDLKVGDIWRPKAGDEVFVLSYQAAITKSAAILKALGLTEWGSRTVDEVQHFPGDYVSKMAFIPARYCIGLTASPWREDGRESYIYALSGRPIGLSWEDFKKMGTIRSPDCHVWIVKDEAAKLRQLDLLVRAGVKTVVFSDHIDPGKAIAKRFDCRFFYGQTKENYTGIKDALATKGLAVVSRIGDEGMSLPELECVIDFDFNYGSRMQSMQRFGRLLHSMEESVDHHVIMPIAEYGRDKKRLYSIYEKGFKIKIHREGVTDKQVERAEAAPQPRRAPRTAPKESVAPVPLPSLPAALTGRLPGIGATINRLLPVEKATATVILANPDRSYSVADLAMATGLAAKTVKDGAHFGTLLRMKLVKKAGTGRYEAAI
ncbi:MAG: hypothetical protein JRN54_04765 [Nitrososphaerota archaeon]|nr:hypothetical protein [Nitrososphaerota archaeon]MDG6970404.1 hypothetical protein [Nitrososphaerota archaeon]